RTAANPIATRSNAAPKGLHMISGAVVSFKYSTVERKYLLRVKLGAYAGCESKLFGPANLAHKNTSATKPVVSTARPSCHIHENDCERACGRCCRSAWARRIAGKLAADSLAFTASA